MIDEEPVYFRFQAVESKMCPGQKMEKYISRGTILERT